MGKPGNGHGLALPEPVAEALQLALQSLQGGEAARVRGPDNEGALNHVFLIETPRGGAVFRMRREASSEQIFDYLDGIYRCTAFHDMSGVFRLRSLQQEIAFMRRALACGLPLPQLLQDGGDWMLIELISGRTAYAAVKDGDLGVIPKVIEALHAAHCQGVIYGDRWGDNEVIDAAGRVRPIDFDVEWGLTEPRAGLLEAMEVGVYLFNALRLTSDRPRMLGLTRHRIIPQLRAWRYDTHLVAHFVEGLARFYLDPDKPGNAWSLPASLYVSLADPADDLTRFLRAA
jgi:hypothetical protein